MLLDIRQKTNIQEDREFQALEEYIITFLEGYFYSDEKFKKLVEATKSCLWESEHQDAFIVLNLFLYCASAKYNKNIQDDREFQALSNGIITFSKMMF